MQLLNEMQHSTTLLSASAVIAVAIIMGGPKWLHELLEWVKVWQARKNIPVQTKTGETQSHSLNPLGRRLHWLRRFGLALDAVLFFGSLFFILSLTDSASPLTLGDAAWLSLATGAFAVSSLRTWR